MKRIFILVVLVVSLTTAFGQNQRERLEQHVYRLAADSLRGRAAGSIYGWRAAQYIAQQFNDMGLKPYFKDYFQDFDNERYHNVIGYIEGNDPLLKKEYIIIGAHYDHLGTRRNEVYNGADDNASGTAAVIEIARNLIARQAELKRSILLVCFDAEEVGLLGSDYMAGGNIEDVRLMMSLDMVGWLKAGKSLRFSGCGMLKDCDKILHQIAEQSQMPISTKSFDNFIFGGTDSDPFARRHVPALHVTTGLKSPYHKPQDDAEKIDYEGLDHVTTYLSEVVTTFANAPQLESSNRVALKHQNEIKPFEAGLLIGYGKLSLSCNDGGFKSTGQLGWHGGAMARYNFKHFAIQLEGYYDHARTLFPKESNPYNEKCSLVQNSITIPMSLQFQLGNPVAAFGIGIGAYYGRVLNSNADDGSNLKVRQDQFGFQWNIHIRISRFLIQYQALYTHPNLLFESDNPMKASAVRRYATIGFLF